MSPIPWLPALGLSLALVVILALVGGLFAAVVSRWLCRPVPKQTTSDERQERRLRLIGGMDRKQHL